MDYGHFIQFCRSMVNYAFMRLPPNLQLNTDQKCVRGPQAEAGCISHFFQMSEKCHGMGCDEYCTVFQARSSKEVCACDAAYLAVSKSKDEHDKDCLKPETFYKLAAGHDVLGFAAKYVSDNIRKEETATFDVLDKDHDGFITRVEAVGSKGWSPLHECADTDKDSKVSQKEYRDKTVGGIASCTEVQTAFVARCKSFDDNKDGQISYSEWTTHHSDIIHVYNVNTIADWDSRKVLQWWKSEVDQNGVGEFSSRRAIMVDTQNQILELHGATRINYRGAWHEFGNASVDSFERMQFPLQYRYTEPYGMITDVPDPSGMNDFRSPSCVDLNSNGVVEISECLEMGGEKRYIAQACSQCSHWIERAGAADDMVLTAAEAMQCSHNGAEIALHAEALKRMHIPLSQRRCGFGFGGDQGTVMEYSRFHCLDVDQDLRVTADECKADGEQRMHMPRDMPPWASDSMTADSLSAWSDEYFRWKAAGPAPAPAPQFLQSHQAPPSPAVAAKAQGRQVTYAECMAHTQMTGWPELLPGSPGPAPSTGFNIMIMDKNRDGKVSRQEAYDYATDVPGADILSTKVDKLFKDADLDLDNFITAHEYSTAGLNHNGDGPHQ